jgi:Fe-S oxidoreductase/nitrate reductase gamma subunit
MPERTDYWGIPLNWRPDLIVYSLMFLAAIILLIRFYQQGSLWWRVGRHEVLWDKIHLRIGRLITYAIVQTRVLSQRYPGIMHVGLAWSFFVFFLGTALATIDSHFIKFLEGNPYLIYKFVLDIFTIFFLFGAVLAGYRRFIQKPPRLTSSSRFTISLVLITLIVLAGLTAESLRLAVEQPDWALWTPVGWLIAQIWIASGASEQTLINLHIGVWGFHLLLAAVTVATLSVGTLWHILTGPLNAFFSNVDQPVGQLKPVAQTAQNEPIYVKSLQDLTWKQLLDGDACTECGRCQDACPAHSAGTALSPKQFILSIRQALHRDGPILASTKTSTQDEINKQLVGDEIPQDVLWSCTTCGACVRECPVLINHVDTIVDMRRHLVIEGQMDGMLQDALANLGRYGNSFGQSDRMRAKWTQPIQPKIKDARREEVEYCWFVGDYASYSASLTEITQKTASVFQKIGLNFGILYDGERNAGNDVRRVGEEGLFEMLAEKNMAVLRKSMFQTIITTDPHSYNSLKNEYTGNGKHPVLHYSELLDLLLTSGKLKLSKKLDYKVTYHDPCYLGRYNGVFDAPRRVIAATGCELIEMPRNRARSFCCGAGGGRIWMEEGSIKERPSEARVHEAVKLDGVQVFVVACPKDITMYRDAVKTTGYEDHIVVKDLIELVEEAL